MRIKRAPVVWKKEDGRVIIMSKKGVFLLNKSASRLWESFDGGEVEIKDASTFVDVLLKAGLVEVTDG